MGRTAGAAGMTESTTKVDIRLRRIEGAWKISLCMVWYSPDMAIFLHSSDDYSSGEQAITAMKRRAMILLGKIGKTETEHDILWRTSSGPGDEVALAK
jgi:hypothetical protein